MRIHIQLKCEYTYENAGFYILCTDDFKILKIFIKQSKFSTIFHRETSQVFFTKKRHNEYRKVVKQQIRDREKIG